MNNAVSNGPMTQAFRFGQETNNKNKTWHLEMPIHELRKLDHRPSLERNEEHLSPDPKRNPHDAKAPWNTHNPPWPPQWLLLFIATCNKRMLVITQRPKKGSASCDMVDIFITCTAKHFFRKGIDVPSECCSLRAESASDKRIKPLWLWRSSTTIVLRSYNISRWAALGSDYMTAWCEKVTLIKCKCVTRKAEFVGWNMAPPKTARNG